MSGNNVHHVESPDQFKSLMSADLNRVSLIYFWAPWAEPCKAMNDVVAELSKQYPQLLVLQVEAEEQPDIAESFDIEAVPTFLLLRGHTLLSRVGGADGAALIKLVGEHLKKEGPINGSSDGKKEETKRETEAQLTERMKGIMNQSPVVLAMKGTPGNPRCGFSRKAVALLRDQNVTFTHIDILEDEAVRQGLKRLNDWPTYPQFFVKGEFVGGLDVVNEMVVNDEFKELLMA